MGRFLVCAFSIYSFAIFAKFNAVVDSSIELSSEVARQISNGEDSSNIYNPIPARDRNSNRLPTHSLDQANNSDPASFSYTAGIGGAYSSGGASVSPGGSSAYSRALSAGAGEPNIGANSDGQIPATSSASGAQASGSTYTGGTLSSPPELSTRTQSGNTISVSDTPPSTVSPSEIGSTSIGSTGGVTGIKSISDFFTPSSIPSDVGGQSIPAGSFVSNVGSQAAKIGTQNMGTNIVDFTAGLPTATAGLYSANSGNQYSDSIIGVPSKSVPVYPGPIMPSADSTTNVNSSGSPPFTQTASTGSTSTTPTTGTTQVPPTSSTTTTTTGTPAATQVTGSTTTVPSAAASSGGSNGGTIAAAASAGAATHPSDSASKSLTPASEASSLEYYNPALKGIPLSGTRFKDEEIIRIKAEMGSNSTVCKDNWYNLALDYIYQTESFLKEKPDDAMTNSSDGLKFSTVKKCLIGNKSFISVLEKDLKNGCGNWFASQSITSPFGSLFGYNAIGGMLNITSNPISIKKYYWCKNVYELVQYLKPKDVAPQAEAPATTTTTTPPGVHTTKPSAPPLEEPADTMD